MLYNVTRMISSAFAEEGLKAEENEVIWTILHGSH